MKRRDFLKTTAAVTGGSLLNELGVSRLVAQNSQVSGARPNILFLLVDELRFPSVFPKGIKDAGESAAGRMRRISAEAPPARCSLWHSPGRCRLKPWPF